VVRSRNDSRQAFKLQRFNVQRRPYSAPHKELVSDSWVCEQSSPVVSIVNKKSRATKKNRAPSILYPLCSRISLFESPYCFEPAIHKRVVQLVQVALIGPLRIFSMLASRSFKNALRRRGSHLTWTTSARRNSTSLIIVRVTWQNIESCYSLGVSSIRLHRHLDETCFLREVHTMVTYFWKVVSTWAGCCQHIKNGFGHCEDSWRG